MQACANALSKGRNVLLSCVYIARIFTPPPAGKPSSKPHCPFDENAAVTVLMLAACLILCQSEWRNPANQDTLSKPSYVVFVCLAAVHLIY